MNLPPSVTTIGSGAFHSCTSLTHVQIPQSVTRIDPDAFRSRYEREFGSGF